MERLKISAGKWKVTLTPEETRKYGLGAGEVDMGEASVRKGIYEILDEMVSPGDVCTPERVYAQFFEDREGGGELFITLLPTHKGGRENAKEREKAKALFRSSDEEDLVRAVRELNLGSKVKNIYSLGKIHILCAEGLSRAESAMLSEYADRAPQLCECFLTEHAQAEHEKQDPADNKRMQE